MVAQDKAPSALFQQLKKELMERRYFSHGFLGHGESFSVPMKDMQEVVRKAHVVVIAMSSSKEFVESEIAIGEAAIEAGVPIVFYSDASGNSASIFFAHMRDDIRMLWVSDEYEKQDAGNFYPSSTEIIVMENPATEPLTIKKMADAIERIVAN